MHIAQWIHKIAKVNNILYPDYRDKPKLFSNTLIYCSHFTGM